MMPLPKFKELLGEEGLSMSDEEVEKAQQALYQLAEIAFDFWQTEHGFDIDHL